MLKIKAPGETKFDALSLGEVMLRLDPGPGRIRNARSFDVWEGGGEYMTIDVTFAFDNYQYSADKAGHTGSRSTRGAGLLDLLGDVAGFADTVRGTLKSGKPRNIQDAVNKLQRIGNSLDNITDNLPTKG